MYTITMLLRIHPLFLNWPAYHSIKKMWYDERQAHLVGKAYNSDGGCVIYIPTTIRQVMLEA